MKRYAWIFAASALLFAAACAGEGTAEKLLTVYRWDGSREEVKLENEFLELRFLPETAEIILREKESGRVWRSIPEGAGEDAAADPVTGQLLHSQFSLLYSDSAGVGMTLSSFEYSVAKGMYEYGAAEGGLEISYTVGNIPRVYYFPAAAPEERMLGLWDRIDRSERTKVEACFRLYDLDKLRSSDNKNALLAAYPDLAEGPVYVLREGTQEHMKVQLEEIFAATGYTRDDFAEDSARYRLEETEKPLFNLRIRYELEGNSLLVSVPFDGIRWRSAYPITRLNLLPFFGAGGIDDEGYIFVPDGSGALIHFNNGKENQIAYNNNIYGWDEGMLREAVISDNRAPYPVFGLRKNNGALLCIIEEGASYGSVRADVSGRNCSYNSVSAQFTLIHGAEMDVSAKSDKAVYLYEGGLPGGERILERFIPCGDTGYAGMAKEYRAYLQKKHPGAFKRPGGGIPAAVEIIGAVNKTQHRLGIPLDLPLKLSSYREARGMLDDFAALGWKDLQVKMTGWFNGGVEHSVPSRIKLIPELGGKGDFADLIAAADRYGYRFYGEGDFLFMKDNGAFDGFSLYRDAARHVSRRRVESYPYSFVWFGPRRSWGKLSYLARPAYMTELIGNFTERAEDLGLKNIAFRTIGSNLAADYNEKRPAGRERAMNMQRELLAKLRGEGRGLWVNTGYAYAVPYADFITDLALGDQGFGITDASVPFYEIALHGLVPYAGRPLNLAEDYTQNLLETVERGAALYFSFMAGESALLQETKFRRYYANEYGRWLGEAEALYKKFSGDFGDLYGQGIEDHTIIAPGVTVTEYERGTRVVVNRGRTAYAYEGVSVAAMDYVVIK